MTDSELEKILKAANAPDRAPGFWEGFPRRVTAKLHWQERRAGGLVATPRRKWGPMAWGLTAGMACLLIGFALGQWRGTTQPSRLLQNEKILREVLAMFPNQVRAIVQDENGLSLSLADQADVPVSPPFWIKVCEGSHCRTIVTFSGQSLQIAGRPVEVLADARGGVILVGDQFFWSNQETMRNDRLRIDVQPFKTVM